MNNYTLETDDNGNIIVKSHRPKLEGVEYNIGTRWEEGVPHHPRSIETYKALEEMDWHYGGDHFCWKDGGDGDNGEALMYLLDIYFDEQDKLKEISP